MYQNIYFAIHYILQFYGMSSSVAMTKHSGGVAEYRSSEGKCVTLPYRGFIRDTIVSVARFYNIYMLVFVCVLILWYIYIYIVDGYFGRYSVVMYLCRSQVSAVYLAGVHSAHGIRCNCIPYYYYTHHICIYLYVCMHMIVNWKSCLKGPLSSASRLKLMKCMVALMKAEKLPLPLLPPLLQLLRHQHPRLCSVQRVLPRREPRATKSKRMDVYGCMSAWCLNDVYDMTGVYMCLYGKVVRILCVSC